MKITKTARTLVSITALAWSIPLAQAFDDQPDRDEAATIELQRDRLSPGRAAPFAAGTNREVANDVARDE